jgi:RimJ/RimL family protein N-acetyltransferase
LQEQGRNVNVFPANQALQPFILTIATGHDEQLEEQLFKKSREPNILQYTPKDAARRFGSKEMFEAWKAGGRELYWLLGNDNDLAGVIWYGKKPAPLRVDGAEQPSETFAIRLYDGYSGHGLAVPAMRQTLHIHVKASQARGEPIAGIWLETDTGNPAALKVYSRFGYHEVHRTDDRVTMVLPASEIANSIKE